MTEEKIFRFEEACKKAGLRQTPQRLAIFEALAARSDHPSANTVYNSVREKMPRISFDTVNRTLVKFVEIGAAYTVGGSGGAKRYDANFRPHQHFKCIKCKRIVDFQHEPFNNIEVPSELSGKFTILKSTVYIEGLCDICKNRDNSQV